MPKAPINGDVIRVLAQVAGLEVARESEPVLAELLLQQIESVRAVPLRDLTEIDLELDFDPGWA